MPNTSTSGTSLSSINNMKGDFIKILRELRGSGAPEAPYTDGIYWELLIKNQNGHPGVYGDILWMYYNFTNRWEAFDTAYKDFFAKYEKFGQDLTKFNTEYAIAMKSFAQMAVWIVESEEYRDETLAIKDEAKTFVDDIKNVSALAYQRDYTVPASATYIQGANRFEFEIPRGQPGVRGQAGLGLNFRGAKPLPEILSRVSSPNEVWKSLTAGTDSYGVAVAVGDLIVGDGDKWFNLGVMQGVQGDQGERGDRGPRGFDQLLGSTDIRAVEYTAKTTPEHLMLGNSTIALNGFAVDSLEIEDGASFTISDGSVFKIV